LGSIIGYTLWITVISVLPLQIAHKTSKIAPFWVFAPVPPEAGFQIGINNGKQAEKTTYERCHFALKLLFINMIKNMTMGVVSAK
jgi:hypothetical protein